MAFKLGSLQHAKGFIVNKLFEQDRSAGRHLAVDDLPSGYPPHWRHLLKTALDELKREGIVRAERKRTGRGHGEHVTLVRALLPQARSLLNGYRASVGLPRLGKDLRTFLPVR